MYFIEMKFRKRLELFVVCLDRLLRVVRLLRKMMWMVVDELLLASDLPGFSGLSADIVGSDYGGLIGFDQSGPSGWPKEYSALQDQLLS